MAYLATKRFTYWGQMGILTAFTGLGFMIGGIASLIPILGKMNLGDVKGASAAQIMDIILKPENTSAKR